jgi:hypothetical protein
MNQNTHSPSRQVHQEDRPRPLHVKQEENHEDQVRRAMGERAPIHLPTSEPDWPFEPKNPERAGNYETSAYKSCEDYEKEAFQVA